MAHVFGGHLGYDQLAFGGYLGYHQLAFCPFGAVVRHNSVAGCV